MAMIVWCGWSIRSGSALAFVTTRNPSSDMTRGTTVLCGGGRPGLPAVRAMPRWTALALCSQRERVPHHSTRTCMPPSSPTARCATSVANGHRQLAAVLTVCGVRHGGSSLRLRRRVRRLPWP